MRIHGTTTWYNVTWLTCELKWYLGQFDYSALAPHVRTTLFTASLWQQRIQYSRQGEGSSVTPPLPKCFNNWKHLTPCVILHRYGFIIITAIGSQHPLHWQFHLGEAGWVLCNQLVQFVSRIAGGWCSIDCWMGVSTTVLVTVHKVAWTDC